MLQSHRCSRASHQPLAQPCTSPTSGRTHIVLQTIMARLADLEHDLNQSCDGFNFESSLNAAPGAIGNLGSLLLSISKATLAGRAPPRIPSSDWYGYSTPAEIKNGVLMNFHDINRVISDCVVGLIQNVVEAIQEVFSAFAFVQETCHQISKPDEVCADPAYPGSQAGSGNPSTRPG